MVSPPADFESAASTDSAIPAMLYRESITLSPNHLFSGKYTMFLVVSQFEISPDAPDDQ